MQTPRLDELVREGIELTRFYAYHMCSPSRSSLMSGRLPIHVNIVNADPTIYNASESSGTGAGIPRNMTGLGQKMKEGGYQTHMVTTDSALHPMEQQRPWLAGCSSACMHPYTSMLASGGEVGRRDGHPDAHARGPGL